MLDFAVGIGADIVVLVGSSLSSPQGFWPGGGGSSSA